ncbi:MAG: BMP family ABC transporter substrate-binding protein, partial [Clostridiales bacterium]|nr:BMP family ABC transporter substrate-binding protein [Clostridiales bacterium]
MKKFLSILLVLTFVFTLAACGGDTGNGKSDTHKVGMVCIGDDNMAYDRNFYMAADAAKEALAAKDINIEWIYTYNHPAGDPVAVDCQELADQGCIAVFCNSYGQEDAMLTVAGDYPDVVFAALTNEGSSRDDLDNTVNAFPNIFEGRYLTGVAIGMKLNEMIEKGEISKDEAVIGYVG